MMTTVFHFKRKKGKTMTFEQEMEKLKSLTLEQLKELMRKRGAKV